MRILVVDDMEENRILLEKILRRGGHEVVRAGNGAEALEALRAGAVDMIISDVLMPVMDGFQLCREVKRDERLGRMPFIFLTATYTDRKDEELGLKLGAERYVRRPVDFDELLRIVDEVGSEKEGVGVKASGPSPEAERETYRLHEVRLVEKLGKKSADATRRKEAEVLLEDHRRRLKAMALESACAEERERRRLADALHDGIGQVLAASKIKTGMLRERTTDEETRKLADEVHAHLDEAIKTVRSFAAGLAPPELDELGFEAGLERVAGEHDRGGRVHVELAGDGRPGHVEGAARMILFHAVRELLCNVETHSRAGRAVVRVEKTGRGTRVRVEDDGVGFDVGAVGKRARGAAGSGLARMRERLECVGGSCTIESAPGKGTRVTIEVPCGSGEEDEP